VALKAECVAVVALKAECVAVEALKAECVAVEALKAECATAHVGVREPWVCHFGKYEFSTKCRALCARAPSCDMPRSTASQRPLCIGCCISVAPQTASGRRQRRFSGDTADLMSSCETAASLPFIVVCVCGRPGLR
jgi:hypothetical protein